MKTTPTSLNRKLATLTVLSLALLSPAVHAANTVLVWDANGSASGTGGSGTWDTSSSQWRLATTSGALQSYTNTSPSTITAEFPTATGTVTLATSTTFNANELLFDTGYTLNGASGSKIVLSAGTGASNSTPEISATGTVTVNAVLDGNSGLVKAGGGTLILGGANTYTGNTTINGFTLSISSFGGTGSTSSSLGAGTGTVFLGSGSNNAVLIYTGVGETTDRTLSISGGASTSGTAEVIENDGSAALNFTSDLADGISGSRFLSFQGSNGGRFSGKISNGTGGGTVNINKAGGGTWILSGANSYTGATAVIGGILNIQNSTALGTIAGGTTVSSGATLQLQNNITVGAEALTVSGTGATGSTGALENVSDANSYGGAITLGANTTVASDAGSLTLSGGITGSFNLALTGAGTGTITNTIGTSTGSVTKSGMGAWTFSGGNTYSGGTTITGGTIYANNAGGASYAVPTSQPRTVTATNGTTSATGSGAVIVQSTGALAGSGTIASTSGGITVQNGGNLISGGTQVSDATHNTVTGTGLTINNAANLTSALAINGGATLTFALGAGPTTGFLNFDNPNTNSTYLSIAGNTAGGGHLRHQHD
jgi:autotransporter-associated beta strand protein